MCGQECAVVQLYFFRLFKHFEIGFFQNAFPVSKVLLIQRLVVDTGQHQRVKQF
jgi:hypothetical protein